MKRSLIPLALLAAAALALAVPRVAAAATASAAANLSQSSVSVSDPALAKVDLHAKFASVDSVCFAFTFVGDLLDPGEILRITPLRLLPPLSGPAVQNVGSTPQAERTLCLDSTASIASLFADGKEKDLELAIEPSPGGSVNIASLVVTVTGTPK